MANFLRCVTTLNSDTGLSEDVTVNVTHWQSTGVNTVLADAQDVANRMDTFYAAVDQLLGSVLGGNANFELFNMADAEPRVPVYSQDNTITPAANCMPTENALCVSFQATPMSGVNQARRRGRIFLGPLSTDWIASGSGKIFANAVHMATVGNAFAASVVGANADAPWLAVFSPTILAAGGTLTQSFNNVTSLWIDNAFDTQRRRGTTPTLRQTFSPS